jgi:hypothetical protein
MTDALRAEWTKLRTLPGTAWLLAGAIALTVAVIKHALRSQLHAARTRSRTAGGDPVTGRDSRDTGTHV